MDEGRFLGIPSPKRIKSCSSMSSKPILLEGSVTRILLMRSLALAETVTELGYMNLLFLMFS